MKIAFLFIMALFSLSATAQFSKEDQYEIDSLNNILNNPVSHDTALVDAYVKLSIIYRPLSLDTLIFFVDKAINIAEKSLSLNKPELEKDKYLKSLASAYNGKGQALGVKGEIEKQKEYYYKSLKINEKRGDKKEIAHSLNGLGLFYKRQGKINKALEFYHKSLKMAEESGSQIEIAASLINIGSIYDDQGEIDKALGNYFKSLSIQEKIGEKEGIAVSVNNIGFAFYKKKDLNKALEYFQKSLKLNEELGLKERIALSLNNIGSIYLKQGDFEKGLAYIQKSLKVREEIGDKLGICESLNFIGGMHLKKGEYRKAKEYSSRSLKMAQELGYILNIKRAADLLSKINREQGSWKEALKYYELFTVMKDSMSNEETQKAAIKQGIKYEYEKKVQADSIKSAEAKKVTDAQLTAQKAQLEQEQTQRYALYGGLSLLFLFGGFMYNRFRITRRQKGIIEKQKAEVEIQKQEAEHQKVLVEEKNKEIMDSIIYARRLQEAILPPKALVKEWLPNSFILYKPKDVVAGDFYWMEAVNDTIYFAAADCTGHGVPGAMVSVVCSHALSKALIEEKITSPSKILDRTRELVIERFEKSKEEVKDGMDISLCALNVKTKQLQWSGANNPLWIINPEREEWPEQCVPFSNLAGGAEIKADKQPIGKYADESPFTNHEIQLQQSDIIYLFSDGYPDQFGGEKGKKFKAANFKKLLLDVYYEPMQIQRDLINETFEKWKGNLEQIDDVCVIGVKL